MRRSGWNGTEAKVALPNPDDEQGGELLGRAVVDISTSSAGEMKALVQESDEGLVGLCLTGEERAFEELVERYNRAIFNYVIRLIGFSEDARDAVQEIFIKAFRSLSKLNPRNKFKSWLYRIAHNHCVDILRRRKPTVALDAKIENGEGGAYHFQLVDRSADPERRALARETGELLEEAIMELPAVFREVIVLRHLQELSYEEIGRVMKMPLGTVKTNIFRGREMLRERLLQRGIS